MKRRFEIKVANDVAIVQDKRQYVRPEIEVINLDEQPKLLSASSGTGNGTAGWGNSLTDGDWEE